MCSCRIRIRAKVAGALYFLALLVLISFSTITNVKALDEPLSMPAVGTAGLKVIAPDLLELTLITTKAPPPARPTQWNFVAANSQYVLPAIGKFLVTADGLPALVQSVGFKRRPVYAPFKVRDLRIGNYLYLKLLTPLHDGQNVQVLNPDGTLWSGDVHFATSVDPLRFSPAIHVNQQGYVPNFPKKAIVGYYIGTLGELNIPTSAGFQIVQSSSGQVVYSGNLVSRGDQGYTFSPAPYQQVFEADFSPFTTPGEYKLVVPGLGASYSFRIDEGAAAAFARTYALGLYHQRCGTDNVLPFTRDTHDICHAAKASVPNMTFTAVNKELADLLTDSPTPSRQTAPALKDVSSSLYPFVNTNAVDVSGGHHDAGDYSKYTINSANLIHTLVFAADAFPGVGALDNLGLPESGDGKSDLLQEAKWEADFLAKMQDTDGGFYFLVYPRRPRIRKRRHCPIMAIRKSFFPRTPPSPPPPPPRSLNRFLAALQKDNSRGRRQLSEQSPNAAGAFSERAIAKYGKDGAYQKITPLRQRIHARRRTRLGRRRVISRHGRSRLQDELKHRSLRSVEPRQPEDGWWRMFEGYGCAIRTYAFAAQLRTHLRRPARFRLSRQVPRANHRGRG